MGYKLIDQYSLLHFATGIIAYFWGIKIELWILINIIFEVFENSPIGLKTLQKFDFLWPGGKKYPDTFINSFGDIISCILGWYVAKLLDIAGKKKNWYKKLN